MLRVLLTALLVFLIAMELRAEVRKWTSKDGQFTTEAEVVEHDNAKVTLKKTSGDTVTVPLERLSDADRRYLRTLKKPTAAKEKKVEKGESKQPEKKGNKEENKPEAKTTEASKTSSASYTSDVQPFLAQYCAECHKREKESAGYNVTSYAMLIRRGAYGALVVPGKPDISRLCEVMEGMSKSMPPSGAMQPPADEIAKIVAWVEAGAKDDSAQPAAPGKAQGSGAKKPSRGTKGKE